MSTTALVSSKLFEIITYARTGILQASVFLILVRESLKIPKLDTERVLWKKYPERSIGASTHVSFFGYPAR